MAKKKSENARKKSKRGEAEPTRHLEQKTWQNVYAVLLFIVAIFFALSSLHLAGPAGEFVFRILKGLFGVGFFLAPLVFGLLGISLLNNKRPKVARTHIIGSIIFKLSGLGIIEIGMGEHGIGGVVGDIVSIPFLKLFGPIASMVIFCGFFIISLMVIFDSTPSIPGIKAFFEKLFKKKISNDELEKEVKISGLTEDTLTLESLPKTEIPNSAPLPMREPEPIEVPRDESHDDDIVPTPARRRMLGAYTPPPLSLLENDRGKPNTGDIKANANIIKRALANFGIEVEMDEITTGPTVTRYAIKPAEGVKLSRILSLQNDLGLALAAHPIRIEAPIPGKSLVGIEVPNRAKSVVGLGTLLGEAGFSAGTVLSIALGKNISGKARFANLAKMPHVLVAGATGAGKSVTIHTIITSLLYRNGPELLKFIMVDPKRVELTLYNGIPHLLTPVITDAKKAILALKWATKEMERRYQLLEEHAVRDLISYHTNVSGKAGPDDEIDPLPYIVVVIDELADIMQSYPRELESAIVRLAQMARAVGIHLILSTQRPSVNVITGLIKANVPSRIALQVSSQIDSRTILDQSGAEKLLGAGDMLYLAGDMASPERLQSAYISEEEVKRVVKFIASQFKDEPPSEIILSGPISEGKTIFSDSVDNDDDDELYEEARQTVIEAGKASTSFLQRKLGVGYARAARLVDMLEEKGIVGPGYGAKPREVLEKPVNNIDPGGISGTI